MIPYIIRISLASILFLSIALSVSCQKDSTDNSNLRELVIDGITFPQLGIIGKDTFVVFTLRQARQTEVWLDEREFCLKQRQKEGEAIRKSVVIIEEQKNLLKVQEETTNIWKKTAKARRRTNWILSAGLTTVSALTVYFIFR